MLDLLHGVPAHPTRPHPIRLNRAFRSDLDVVAHICSGVEWNLLPLAPVPSPPTTVDVRCLRIVGLWRMARSEVVSAPMGPEIRSATNYGQRASPHRPGVCCLGTCVG